METANVGQSLECLVSHNGQRRTLGEPSGIVERLFFFEWLLHKEAILIGKPFCHFERLLLGFPSLVGIHIEFDVRANATHQFVEVFVLFNAPQSHFHLNEFEIVGFGHFLSHLIVGVDTDGASGERCFFRAQPPNFVPRLPHEFAQKVV